MSEAGRTPPSLGIRLSIMMFLQYAIWGAWLPLFYAFLTEHRALEPAQAGNLFAIGAIGALIAPFLGGQIVDRWFNTEKFLGISHIVGAVLVWQLATVDTYGGLIVFSLLYSLIYAPTLSLTNSLAFHHLADRDRDFGRVRVWGTVGWIVVGIGIGQWLLLRHTPADDENVRALQVAGMADAFRLSAILGLVLGVFCFTLPRTPPRKGERAFAALEAIGELKKPRLLWLFLIAFPVSCIHQFYFVHTAAFLDTLDSRGAEAINHIFGVGGGGLMTVGQIAEILVLALIPFAAKRVSRKTLLTVGLVAYALRFAIFAYATNVYAVIFGLALHGLCFGCFIFVAFMIVDEESGVDVRASAQSLFNLVVVGLGIIVGNIFAGRVAQAALGADGVMDYGRLFGPPMWVAVACLLGLVLMYPGGRRTPEPSAAPGTPGT